MKDADAVYLFFALFISIFVAGFWRRAKLMKHMRKRNFDWYRATYPTHVRNGRVTCHKCEAERVSARGMLRRTYMREHFCTQCGETLYYSPEASTLR